MLSLPLNFDSMHLEPFCDYLNISSPKDNGDLILRELMPLFDVLGASKASDHLFMMPDKGGAFKIDYRGKVVVFSVSGGVLAALRRQSLFDDYLRCFVDFDHRVSMLHATADFRLDGPTVIQAFKSMGQSGKASLTRKKITPQNVHSLLSLDADGCETGTIYFGNRRNSDVWAKVYDKRHERLSKGFSDIGPMVRIEIAVQTDVGATLHDAQHPAAIFHHFANPCFVSFPLGMRTWEPMAQAYAFPTRILDLTGIQRLKGILDFSPDIRRLLSIATEEFADEGFDVLSGLLKKQFSKMHGVGHLQIT